ncbi:hypothetical protein HZH68_003351 [Vespula germanica]|uniref:Ig-like domain-containing protein n=1 Tax=Vespula germanica TaxID=30212 RepID=A0A834NP28_VESGE|nr:hypothetical protein HZH68_003351 [Vespula germanica]
MSKKEEDEEGKEGSSRRISWIRRRDFHVLTSSTFTYTNDERFQVLHAEGSDDWTLQIKYVQERDNGTYECQRPVCTGLLMSNEPILPGLDQGLPSRKRSRSLYNRGVPCKIRTEI